MSSPRLRVATAERHYTSFRSVNTIWIISIQNLETDSWLEGHVKDITEAWEHSRHLDLMNLFESCKSQAGSIIHTLRNISMWKTKEYQSCGGSKLVHPHHFLSISTLKKRMRCWDEKKVLKWDMKKIIFKWILSLSKILITKVQLANPRQVPGRWQ